MAEMLLAKDHDVIAAVPPDRSNQPLRESILPRRSSRNRAVTYAHRCEAPNEGLAIGAIAITNDIARRLTPAASLGSLTGLSSTAWILVPRPLVLPSCVHRRTSPRLLVLIGWLQRDGSTSHVAKMLNKSERIELDVIDRARACVPRHPWGACPRAGELQYSCNRCLCFNSHILTHRRSWTGVPCANPRSSRKRLQIAAVNA
jgi:hypothetical protein